MRIPVYILTGFLGSGKTTMLNRCLSDSRFADTAVLINEFGEVSLDHLLVKNVDEDIVVLESGCVCCSVRDDFTAALLDLAQRRDESSDFCFGRVVLETTGIADPNAIHQVLMSDPEIRQRFLHAGTITVVDAVFGQQSLDRHLEAVAQVAIADRLLMSKTDLATTKQIEQLSQQLQQLNPTAVDKGYDDLVPLLDEMVADADIVSVKDSVVPLRDIDAQQHQNRFSTFRVRCSTPLEWDDVKDWLEALLFARGNDIYRIKGLANVKGDPRPTVLHSVQHALYPPQYLESWPNDAPCTDLTFICKDFTATAARRSLLQVCAIASGTRVVEESSLVRPSPRLRDTAITTAVEEGVQQRIIRGLRAGLPDGSTRFWHTCYLHNPWSLAATVVDSWAILNECQAEGLLDAIAAVIGSDLVLFDSRILRVQADGISEWQNDAEEFPVEPRMGAVARLPLKPQPGWRFCGRYLQADINVLPDQFIVHDAKMDYRYAGVGSNGQQHELVLRYFPSTSRFIRDPSHPYLKALMEREPLINHAQAALWLVSGEDKADNDFVAGLRSKSAYWSAA